MKVTYTGAVLLQALQATASPFRRNEQTTPKLGLTFQARSPAPFREPSPNTVTPQTIPLRRRFSNVSTSKSIFPKIGVEALEFNFGLGEMIAEIDIGNQTFGVIFDTGSSDLWVAGEDYTCISANATIVSNDVCNITSPFKGTYSGGIIPDLHLNVLYGTGAALGTMGFESVTLAGLTIPRQQMSIANIIEFPGMGNVSGLLGMAYPQLTSAFLGNETGYADDNRNTTLRLYDNLVTNIFKDNLTKPLFSLAMDRNGDGVFAMGGLPPVPFQPEFASTPILIVDIGGMHDKGDNTMFTFYTIVPDSFVFGKGGSSSSNGSTAGGAGHPASPGCGHRRQISSRAITPLKSSRDLKIPDSKWTRLAKTHYTSRSLNSTKNTFPIIVDSGTTFTYLPSAIVQALYNEFAVRPTPLPGMSAYGVLCNITAPTFGVEIAGKTFFMDEADLVLREEMVGDMCVLGVQPVTSESSPFILGATFLENVVTVFDVGASEMRFAARIPY